jgi:methylthioribose-1-phosphate isomerase
VVGLINGPPPAGLGAFLWVLGVMKTKQRGDSWGVINMATDSRFKNTRPTCENLKISINEILLYIFYLVITIIVFEEH